MICKAEAPTVVEVAALGRESGGFTVVGVAGLAPGEDPRPAVEEWGIGSFPNIADTGPVWARFAVFGQPAAIVVTADGGMLGHMGALDEAGFLDLIARARAA